MCGRYAFSRKPDDLIEEFEIEESRVDTPLAADYNVAPTKEVYAVVERPPETRRRRPAPAAGPDLGADPVLGQGPQIGNRMINARMESVAEKPAYRRAFAVRRCLLPADGYFEWYPTEKHRRASRASSRSSSAPRTTARWRWPVSTRSGATPPRRRRPDRFRWTCTVLTTEAEDAVGHIHDRMPLMVEPERWDAWLDPPYREGRPACPARAGRTRAVGGLPRLDPGQQRAQQRPRAGGAAAASEPEGGAHDPRAPVSRPRTAPAGW